MSNEAPERIWACPDETGISKDCGEWDRHDCDNPHATPYIREDLHAAEVQRLQDRVRELEGALGTLWRATTYPVSKDINPRGFDLMPVTKQSLEHVVEVIGAALNREGGE